MRGSTDVPSTPRTLRRSPGGSSSQDGILHRVLACAGELRVTQPLGRFLNRRPLDLRGLEQGEPVFEDIERHRLAWQGVLDWLTG